MPTIKKIGKDGLKLAKGTASLTAISAIIAGEVAYKTGKVAYKTGKAAYKQGKRIYEYHKKKKNGEIEEAEITEPQAEEPTQEEAEQLAAQMFDQFPVMSSVYGKPSRFIDEFYNNFAIRVGRTSINRLGAQYPNHIEITPFRSGNALLDKWVGGRPGSRPPPLLGGARQFIANTLDDNSRVYTHELDHWFRTKVIEKTGADPSRQYRDVYDAEGMVIRENWLKKWWEFEAEFTTVQFRLLDQIGSKGATPDVVRILENPVEFEKYFLANLKGITVDWEEPIYNQLMQRIRGRLFDTERGLYWALRRAFEIPDPPRKPLPENIQINLRRWSTLAGII